MNDPTPAPREPVRLAEVEAAAEGAAKRRWWSEGTVDMTFAATVDPPTVKAMVEALRLAESVVESIGRTYTAVVCGDITEPTAWARIEAALRGDPPEGEPIIGAIHDLVDFSPAALRQPTYTEPGGPE